MGGRGSREIHHHHHTIKQILVADPNQKKQYEATIDQLLKDVENARMKCDSPQQFKLVTMQLEDKYIGLLKTMKFSQGIRDKKGFHVCFIGPTSCGKSTLLNQLFNLNLNVGIGSTTKQATLIQTKSQWIYWDAPGINDDFGFYRAEHLNFFNDLDLIFILFETQVDSVRLIIKAFVAMNKKLLYVRTQCDKHKEGMKSIKQELENDVKQIQRYDPSCKAVIPVGFGMYEQIKKHLK